MKSDLNINKTNSFSILKEPRVTEKATVLQGFNVYTFNVPKSATKPEIVKSIKELYKVTPVKVRTVTLLAKKVFVRGKRGTKAGGKKAYVYLKKEDKIKII